MARARVARRSPPALVPRRAVALDGRTRRGSRPVEADALRVVPSIAARLRRGDLPVLRRASWAMYDRYLKANRVESGVRSYGAVVTLILRARFENDWRPVRRAFAGPGP